MFPKVVGLEVTLVGSVQLCDRLNLKVAVLGRDIGGLSIIMRDVEIMAVANLPLRF